MPRSRSRSRSNRRDGDRGGRDRRDDRRDDGHRREGVAEAAKSGSSEQEIVSVAIRQLPGDIRERLEKLFEEGLLKEGDLDLRSITVFASLNEGLQARVMNHMENERIYVANARSKSGFLIATCDKAKTGCLDARGLGAIDPWRTALVAMATPKQRMLDLKSERDFIDAHDEGAVIKINVNVNCVEKELGVPSVTVELPLNETSAAVKAKLVAMGVKSLPANKMKLHTDPVGFLKEGRTFAYYNLEDGVNLQLSQRKRAGVRFRADHTAMPKRPRTQPAPGETPSPADALSKLVGGNAAAKLPALPALPKLPGLAGTLAGTVPGSLPGLAGTLAGTVPGSLPSTLPGLGLPLSMPGTSPGLAGGTAPGALGSLLAGVRPALPAGMTLPGGLTLPGGTGPAPGLPGLAGLSLPKLGIDAKAAMPALLSLSGPAGGPAVNAPKMPPLLPTDPKAAPADGKAPPPGVLPPPAMNLLPPGMSGPGLLPPPTLPKLGSLPPMTMPAMGAGPGGPPGMGPPGMGGLPPNMGGPPPGMGAPPMVSGMAVQTKGGGPPAGPPGGLAPPGGMPGLPPPGMSGPPGGLPGGPPGMGMPPMDMPKAQSKSQMPTMPPAGGSFPKLPGGPGMPPPGVSAPPVSEAMTAATAKAAPA